MCNHKNYFGLVAELIIFATSHGKSPCDGIGGTVKRLTARANLQRPLDKQILSVDKMFEFCCEKIKNINFINIKSDHMVNVRDYLNKRFKNGRTMPGTRSFHHFFPVSTKTISFKSTSEDTEFNGIFNIIKDGKENSSFEVEEQAIKLMDFVACKYDNFWWLGLISEINNTEKDNAHVPSKSFTWPNRDDCCWVPFSNIIQVVKAPATRSGRTYEISNEDYESIIVMKVVNIA